ncbi:serine/threonine-protein kinase RsbW [Syntrophus gentianae]|uniref:Serine/threonine-protein kinase RsbW n=2 Tax=Syntrophus gentianae TaxID=43775 RepID=A0A1H7Y1X2_9BACT|nr:serine/threonine-protein kinase RsbW [Syntrophus gentianae]
MKLIIESKLENVTLVGGAVRGIANALSLDEISCYHLELCVVEAVTNVTKHAYNNEAGNPVEVNILLFPDRISFQICDRGKSMEPANVRLLNFDPEQRETLPESGMGLFIMHALMDEVRYETVSGLNVLTMSKYLRQEGKAPVSPD